MPTPRISWAQSLSPLRYLSGRSPRSHECPQPPRPKPMKPFPSRLLIAGLAGSALAQNSPSPPKLAVIEGIVIKDPGSQPVKKAVIELIAESQPGGTAYTAVTAADGLFHI